MTSTIKFRVFVLTILATTTGLALAYAGAVFRIKCTNDECSYEDSFHYGGGFVFEEIAGYCTNCGKFVALKWGRQGGWRKPPKSLPRNKPKPVGMIWIAQTGQTVELYACPLCSKPYAPIETENDIRFCPKCNSPNPQVSPEGVYD